MTTPRKHWFKVYISSAQEFADNDELACFHRLLAAFKRRWVEGSIEPGGALCLTNAELCAIAGRPRIDYALPILERVVSRCSSLALRYVGASSELGRSYVGASYELEWPKYWKSQSFGAPQMPQKEKEKEKEKKKERKTGDSAPRTPRLTPWILEAIATAFATYGKKISTWSDARKRAIVARLREHGDPAALSEAVHGYVYHHRAASEGFDPMAYFTPETIFRPSNFPKYLESAQEARAAGRSPPYGPGSRREGNGKPVGELEAKLEALRAAGWEWCATRGEFVPAGQRIPGLERPPGISAARAAYAKHVPEPTRGGGNNSPP